VSLTPIGEPRQKITVASLKDKKLWHEPITCLTAYDYASARLVARSTAIVCSRVPSGPVATISKRSGAPSAGRHQSQPSTLPNCSLVEVIGAFQAAKRPSIVPDGPPDAQTARAPAFSSGSRKPRRSLVKIERLANRHRGARVEGFAGRPNNHRAFVRHHPRRGCDWARGLGPCVWRTLPGAVEPRVHAVPSAARASNCRAGFRGSSRKPR